VVCGVCLLPYNGGCRRHLHVQPVFRRRQIRPGLRPNDPQPPELLQRPRGQCRHPLRPHKRDHSAVGGPDHGFRPQLLRLLHDMARGHQENTQTAGVAHVPLHLHRRQLSVLRQHRLPRHLRQELPREPWRGVGHPQRLRGSQWSHHHAALLRLLLRRLPVLDSAHSMAPSGYLLRFPSNHSLHEARSTAQRAQRLLQVLVHLTWPRWVPLAHDHTSEETLFLAK